MSHATLHVGVRACVLVLDVLARQGVGKTCLLLRYAYETFSTTFIKCKAHFVKHWISIVIAV